MGATTVRVFGPRPLWDAWDVAFAAARSGELQLGDVVKVWNDPFEGDYRNARWMTVKLEMFWGAYSFREV